MGAHAAPTLLGLKVASLVAFRKSKFPNFTELLASYRPCFACRGISVCRLSESRECVLILFYRAAKLERLLAEKETARLLSTCGYPEGATLGELLAALRQRLQEAEAFPHEIGLFLGYPVEDVKGFMQHRGHDFLYSGYWKVYANETATRRLFDLYTACTKEFCAKLAAGVSLSQLLQAG
ncbi:MAG: DUF3793 family protein [Selenomonadaceae bacterium]|nr:DUF3793 family protein [Selenomonadaceae bacterium]